MIVEVNANGVIHHIPAESTVAAIIAVLDMLSVQIFERAYPDSPLSITAKKIEPELKTT